MGVGEMSIGVIIFNEDSECRCVSCGCAGNEECGHPPPQWALDSGRGCALDRAGYCPCCCPSENIS